MPIWSAEIVVDEGLPLPTASDLDSPCAKLALHAQAEKLPNVEREALTGLMRALDESC